MSAISWPSRWTPVSFITSGKLEGWSVHVYNKHPDFETGNYGENCVYYNQIFMVKLQIWSAAISPKIMHQKQGKNKKATPTPDHSRLMLTSTLSLMVTTATDHNSNSRSCTHLSKTAWSPTMARAHGKVKSKVCRESSSQSNLPHHYGNSHAIWDHTVLPATRQMWRFRLYPNQSWYSIKRSWRDATPRWPSLLVLWCARAIVGDKDILTGVHVNYYYRP